MTKRKKRKTCPDCNRTHQHLDIYSVTWKKTLLYWLIQSTIGMVIWIIKEVVKRLLE